MGTRGRQVGFIPTNMACLLVDRVHLLRHGASIVEGDTICFKYATSNNYFNPDKPGLMGFSGGLNGPLGSMLVTGAFLVSTL